VADTPSEGATRLGFIAPDNFQNPAPLNLPNDNFLLGRGASSPRDNHEVSVRSRDSIAAMSQIDRVADRLCPHRDQAFEKKPNHSDEASLAAPIVPAR
jgi:hypothetical protein